MRCPPPFAGSKRVAHQRPSLYQSLLCGLCAVARFVSASTPDPKLKSSKPTSLAELAVVALGVAVVPQGAAVVVVGDGLAVLVVVVVLLAESRIRARGVAGTAARP